jgi:putative transcriptional regulator
VALHAIEPGFLLAAPSLGDPNFEATVVLLGMHDDEDGSLGWIVNGPEIALGETIVRATDLVDASMPLPPGFSRPARRGGPVAMDSVWILYDRRGIGEPLPGSIAVGDEIAVTATTDALKMLVEGRGPSTFQLLVGYAGWGAGQLAHELALGAWLPADASAPLLFDAENETLWRRAYAATIGTVPGAFVSTTRGSA